MRLGHLALAVLLFVFASCRSESTPAPHGRDVEPQNTAISGVTPDRVPERYAFLYDWRAAEGITKEELAAELPLRAHRAGTVRMLRHLPGIPMTFFVHGLQR